MAKLVWDNVGERLYETGVNQVVLYPQAADGTYPKGVAWNGITNVSEKPTGAEATALYADNTKYLNLVSNEDLEASIEAYMYPDEFAACDGSAEIATGVTVGQQNRTAFGLSFKTIVGNDVKSNTFGYKLHLIYGCLASPSEKGYSTVNDSPEAITFSWEVKTTPVNVDDKGTYKPTARIVIDSTKLKTEAQKKALADLEEILYGTDSKEASLPLPAKIMELFAEG